MARVVRPEAGQIFLRPRAPANEPHRLAVLEDLQARRRHRPLVGWYLGTEAARLGSGTHHGLYHSAPISQLQARRQVLVRESESAVVVHPEPAEGDQENYAGQDTLY